MFLNSLNDKQKTLFLELAIKAAEANGTVELEEKNMLKTFAIEMNIRPFYTTERKTEEIVNELMGISNERDLKIILFEILGILISDKVFDINERTFIDNVVKTCNMDTSLVEKMLNLLNDYVRIYNNIIDVVLK